MQPSPSPVPERVLSEILDRQSHELRETRLRERVVRDQHSNQVMELRFEDGRTLMVKRARHDWASGRFRVAREASRVLRAEARLLVPVPLDVPEDPEGRALEVYWRIPLPTLQELWPTIPAASRPGVLRSWGALARRIHDCRYSAHGSLIDAPARTDLHAFLERELTDRLFPAVCGEWPEGLEILEALREALPEVARRAEGREPRLLHNDLHMGNILCLGRAGRVRCVGVLDLEAAFAGPVEADLAHTHVLHGPVFDQGIEGEWFEHLRQGYGVPLDDVLLAFFRGYHLLNLGFFSALIGNVHHAARIAAAAREALRALGDLLPASGSSGTALAG
jgi:aminoglycoside phosphotransferase (APT) family kinase protein